MAIAAAQPHENDAAIPPEGHANALHSQPSTIAPPTISPEQSPTIQRQILPPSPPTPTTVPDTWSSLADLITQSTPSSSPSPPSPPIHPSTPSPPTLQPFRDADYPAPTPIEPANPPGETITAPTAENTDQNVDALEDLAQEIYGLLKTRLAIERERRGGGYSGRMPW